ncbi:MAG: relaxase/mobilization nuclease domain-containing protein [Rikenellaceae bacterium]
MMAKIMKGTSFGGCVRYVLNEEKAELLKLQELPNGEANEIAADFELQSQLNPKVKNIVGHIALCFSPKDERLIDDDEMMVQIAEEYMERMGISNTQYLIARHIDRDHPHCHIVYNRVDNDGRTISDKNDMFRSEKICKMLTAKHRLHFAEGKDQVNEDRLKHGDAKKYHIYNTIKGSLPMCQSWDRFERCLRLQGIEMEFKYNGNTSERQGVKFKYDGASFSGSKIDRAYSFAHLDDYFQEMQSQVNSHHQQPQATELQQVQSQESKVDEDIAGGLLSILSMPADSGGDYDEDEVEFARQQRLKKKQRKGRRM